MVRINTEYVGDLHCVAEHDPSGVTLTTDAPKDNHGRGETFSPTDLVATALSTCVATILGIEAEKRGVRLEGMNISVEKEMTSDPRRIALLRAEVQMPRPLDEQTRTHLEHAGRQCPVHESLHPDVEVSITFRWPETIPED